MALDRLTWRVGLPFVLLVLVATVVLALVTSRLVQAEESRRFARVATRTRHYLDQGSMDTSEALARDLTRVTGHDVFFRRAGQLQPRPPASFVDLPLATHAADGEPVRRGGFEFVVTAVPGKRDLVIVRALAAPWRDPLLLQVLAAFWGVAILTAWSVVRGLVRPLRNLARQLPNIEQPGPLDLPEANRGDEIGDVARAFVRTRRQLHDEQAARERVEKLAVLGRMTAALAHEVQNPVAAIRMHAQLWRAGAGDADAAATIEHEAARIESMLNGWMFLTRPEPPALTDVDVGALLRRVAAMFRAQAEHAAVRVALEAGDGLIAAADGRRLEQVVRNLLTNALQAMAGGGELVIRARRGPAGVIVEFADTGPGFSPAALQRFAEFFFTEKEGGMGIGLSVASEILKAHGGTLRAANRERGAVVTLTLPASAPARAAGTAL